MAHTSAIARTYFPGHNAHTSLLLALLTAYPVLHWLAAKPGFDRLLGVELWLSFIYASYNGALVMALTEIMPVEVRTAGFSLACSLATTLGNSSLAISRWLIISSATTPRRDCGCRSRRCAG